MKAKRINTEINLIGGALPVLKILKNKKIAKVIESCLGKRVNQAKYSYSDCLTSFMLTIFSSGFRLLKVTDIQKQLANVPGLNIPSHDTMGRMLKRLAIEPTPFLVINRKNPNDGAKGYLVSENQLLNELLIQSTLNMEMLKPKVPYTLDIDATILESGVRDAAMTYKRHRGFTPMVCMINQLPVFISMRSGNANPHYKKLDCLKKCLELLKKYNIIINRVRIDGAGYKQEILDYLDSENIEFVIGANWSERTLDIVNQSPSWAKKQFSTSNHVWDAELSTSTFQLKGSSESYKIAAIRVKDDNRKKKDKPTKWRLYEGYYYKFVITNDENASAYDIFKEYHHRGKIEKNFDALKNDYGWRILPFSKIHENLVYLILTSMANNVYHGLLKLLTKVIKHLDLTMRLEKFKSIFINAAFSIINGEVVYYGRSNIPHHKLI